MRLISLIIGLMMWAGSVAATDSPTGAAQATCDTAMAAPIEHITALELEACHTAGQDALSGDADPTVAAKYLAVVCAADHLDLSPAACADLGRMYADGRGVAASWRDAQDFFAQSCFHPRVETADGAGCLRYGMVLLAHWADSPVPENETTLTTVVTASRAFQRGCADANLEACAANDVLGQVMLAGDYGYTTSSCTIRDNADQITSRETCMSFDHYSNLTEGEMLEDGNHIDTYYIWPESDRTRTAYRGGFWSLNGRATGDPRLIDGDMCLVNPLTERQFCAALPDAFVDAIAR